MTVKKSSILFAVIVYAIIVCGCSQSPEKVIEKNISAFNNRDVDGFISTLHTDYLSKTLDIDVKNGIVESVINSLCDRDAFMSLVSSKRLSEAKERIKIQVQIQFIVNDNIHEQEGIITLAKSKSKWEIVNDLNEKWIKEIALYEDKDLIIGDLTNLSAKAYKYRITPKQMDGGGGSYLGIKIDHLVSSTDSSPKIAEYKIINASANSVTLQAEGSKWKQPWIIQVRVDNSGINNFKIVEPADF